MCISAIELKQSPISLAERHQSKAPGKNGQNKHLSYQVMLAV